jgi:hypothetical protein
LEVVRRQSAPDLPTRLNVAFAFDKLSDAETFHPQRASDAIYEVEPERLSRMHRANIMLLHPDIDRIAGRNVMAINAREYWLPGSTESDGQRGDELIEVLVEGPLVVRRLLQNPIPSTASG